MLTTIMTEKLKRDYFEPSKPEEVRSSIIKSLVLKEDKEALDRMRKDMKLSMSDLILEALDRMYVEWASKEKIK